MSSGHGCRLSSGSSASARPGQGTPPSFTSSWGGAQNALVQAVQLGTVCLRLDVLAAVGGRRGSLQVWLDRFVLLVGMRKDGDEVLDHVAVGEWVDAGFLGCVCGNAAWG